MTAREKVLAALETAKKATPGRWSILKGLKQNSFRRLSDTIVLRSASKEQESICCFYGHKTNDAAFVATMNPEFAQALLEGWLILEGALEETLAWTGDRNRSYPVLKGALQSARAKFEKKEG